MVVLRRKRPDRIRFGLVHVLDQRLQARAVLHAHHQVPAVLNDLQYVFRAVGRRNTCQKHACAPVRIRDAGRVPQVVEDALLPLEIRGQPGDAALTTSAIVYVNTCCEFQMAAYRTEGS